MARQPKARMSLAETMAALEAAGTEQNRKTWRRHGAKDPMFGVSFATLKALLKRIDVDHELAHLLWDTGNYDARNLAVKVVDPARMTRADLERWALEQDGAPMGASYVAMIASEGPMRLELAEQWLASTNPVQRSVGWVLLGQLAHCDETLADEWFQAWLTRIETTIHTAPNDERGDMNAALIRIGTRNAALRDAAVAAANRIGTVAVDHGDTYCKTPEAVATIEKAWTHSVSKGFVSPAAHERSRELLRRRC